MTIINMAAQPYTSESFMVGTASVVALTKGLFAPSSGVCRSYADRAMVSVEAGNARFKMNGSSPATACGHLLADGNYLILDDPSQMRNLKIYNEGATASAYVHVTYFGG